MYDLKWAKKFRLVLLRLGTSTGRSGQIKQLINAVPALGLWADEFVCVGAGSIMLAARSPMHTRRPTRAPFRETCHNLPKAAPWCQNNILSVSPVLGDAQLCAKRHVQQTSNGMCADVPTGLLDDRLNNVCRDLPKTKILRQHAPQHLEERHAHHNSPLSLRLCYNGSISASQWHHECTSTAS